MAQGKSSVQLNVKNSGPGVVCPFLGTFEDPSTACHYPTPRNACHKLKPALTVPLTKQDAYCLNSSHRGCAVFQDRQRRADVRRSWKEHAGPTVTNHDRRGLRRWWQRLREEAWSPRTIIVAVGVLLLIPVTLLVLQVATADRRQGAAAAGAAESTVPTQVAQVQAEKTSPVVLPSATMMPTATALPDPSTVSVVSATPARWEPPPITRESATAVPTPAAQAAATSAAETPPDGATIYHVVQPGQSVQQLARMYQTTPAAILDRNGLDAAADIQTGDEIAIPATVAALTATPTVVEQPLIRHVVQPGEYLSQLVSRYDTSLAAVLAVNPYGNGVGLHPGRVLFIPAPSISGS